MAHLIVKEAYALGAHEVIVQWTDDVINREKFLHAPMERLDNVPEYKIAEMNYFLENKASRLGVRSSDPGALISFGTKSSKLAESTKQILLRLGKNMQLSLRVKLICSIKNNFQPFTTQRQEQI